MQETPLEQLRKEAKELALRAKSQMEAEWDRLVSGPPNYDGIDGNPHPPASLRS